MRLVDIINEWEAGSSQLYRVGAKKDESLFVQVKIQELIYDLQYCYLVTMTDVTKLIELVKFKAKNRFENEMTLHISKEMASPIQSIVHMAKHSEMASQAEDLRQNMKLILYTA